ncbi:DUF1350 family protein [Altericista sp. CCNU0014]|uniref:DUF1350 family protein n=1 Tax=Altericista sp. CCNU0014 TaxID=3082949 RepID=UPI00384D3437
MNLTDQPNQSIALPHGFASIHPDPEGVVHFIGGYFFGSGVSCWYKTLLDSLQQRFTVHSYSYSFAQLSHWTIAKDLLEQIEQVKQAGIKTAKQMGYNPKIYTDPSKHCLVGHSLGCECIGLIRFLGFDKNKQIQILEAARHQLGAKIVTDLDFSDVKALPQLQSVPYRASLLMAPCFKTPTAVSWLLQVRPQQDLVRYLIQQNPQLLSLTSLLSFKGDTIAGPDVGWCQPVLKSQGSLQSSHEIDDIHHPYWIALQYHMIPAFDPIRSRLAAYAADFIGNLVNSSTP